MGSSGHGKNIVPSKTRVSKVGRGEVKLGRHDHIAERTRVVKAGNTSGKGPCTTLNKLLFKVELCNVGRISNFWSEGRTSGPDDRRTAWRIRPNNGTVSACIPKM